MVETNISNDREKRRDDISTIDATTEPHFDNGDIHLLTFEIFKSQSSSNFEKRRMQLFDPRRYILDKICHILLRNHLAVNTDTLAKIAQMRRSIEPYFIALRLKDGSQ